MAYSASTMRLMGGVPGQQLFLYRTADPITTCDNSGYFDDAVDDYNLDTGDIIIIVTGYGTTNVLDALVATNTSGTVTTALLS